VLRLSSGYMANGAAAAIVVCRIVVVAGMHAIKNKKERYFKLIERALLGPRTKCQLSGNSEEHKNVRCSVCHIKEEEFEFDHVLAQLIENGTIHQPRLCPYQFFAGMLLDDLEDGPDAQLVSMEKLHVAIKALAKAQESITGALTLFGDDIEIHKHADELYQRLNNLKSLQRFIPMALTSLKARHKEPRPRRGGRPRKLDAHGITDCCSSTWRVLVGKEANQKNTRFQDLLSATWIAVHGANEREPDWEHQIKAAKKRRTAR
jgi:hypothetical protein